MKVLTPTEPIVCHVLSCALYTGSFIVPIVQVRKLRLREECDSSKATYHIGSVLVSAPEELALGVVQGSVSICGQGSGQTQGVCMYVGGGPATPCPRNNSNLPASPFIKGPRGPALTLIRMMTPASGVISPNMLFSLEGGVGKAWGWRSGLCNSPAALLLCRGYRENGHGRGLGRVLTNCLREAQVLSCF